MVRLYKSYILPILITVVRCYSVLGGSMQARKLEETNYYTLTADLGLYESISYDEILKFAKTNSLYRRRESSFKLQTVEYTLRGRETKLALPFRVGTQIFFLHRCHDVELLSRKKQGRSQELTILKKAVRNYVLIFLAVWFYDLLLP